MRKKWGIVCAILVICGISLCSVWKKPKIVNCITTMDTAYITVLWNDRGLADKEKAAETVIELCKKNAFQELKLSEETQKNIGTYYITIYKSVRQMKRGKNWITFYYNREENSMKIL